MNISNIVNGHSTAEARWARYGPYYAVFPVDFAFNVINKYSKRGDNIIDPFAGRCTSVYAGGVLGRNSLGFEINPVGWLYGTVKIHPAKYEDVIERLQNIRNISGDFVQEADELSEFFHVCYCNEVLNFLCTARKSLDWKNNPIDATLMSIILIYLHGKIGEGISNQMRMTMSMGMNYSINWWKKNNMPIPPEINPYDFFIQKLQWRYKKGVPQIQTDAQVILGDCTKELQRIVDNTIYTDKRYSLLFTSPPYYAVTDYHVDQWLRLWMLGGTPYPKSANDSHRGRFGNKEDYYKLLDSVFEKCSHIMAPKSTIYVRTDSREYTLETTLEILNKYFPDFKQSKINKPIGEEKRTQTDLYGNHSNAKGEVDIILRR